MAAKVVTADYRDAHRGYPWLVMRQGEWGGWFIESYHRTRKEAQAVADDINGTNGEGESNGHL